MYSQYGDTQYPHGPELGPIRGQMPVDPSGGPARYPYMSYYGSKGPDSAQLAAVMAQRPPYGGEFSSMGNPEAMYNPGWNSMMPGPGYMGPHVGKPGPYGIQGMGGFPGAPGYPGPPHQFPSGGHYPPYGGGGSQSPMPSNHASLLQQQQQQQAMAAGRHRFTPPTAEGSSSGEGPHFPGGMPGGVHPHSGSGPPWPSQGLPHQTGGGRSYAGDQPSPGAGGGAWHGTAPPYQGVEPGGPSTPGSGGGGGSRATPHSSSSSSSSSSSGSAKLKAQEKGTASPLSQSQQAELLSPHSNSELPKTSSISSLRDALLASTTTTASSTQQYTSYPSPRMAEHQPSPVTPEGGGGLGAAPGISPQISVTGPSRQDSQLSTASGSGQGQQQQQEAAAGQQYSRQNSTVPPPGVKGDASQPPSQEDRSRVSPLHVESILGIKDNQPVDPPLSNSLREGGGGGSNVSSPHTTQSPHGDAAGGGTGGGGMLAPVGVTAAVASGGQDRQSPAPGPGRPELLGFPAKSPSFRSQPSPLAEESKSAPKIAMSPVDRSHPSISAQYDGDQKRKDFLDSLFSYLEKEGIQLVRLPLICKAPFDLYKIFNSVQQHGGFTNVTEKRLWRDVVKTAYGATSGLTSGAVRNVQQYYLKLLLPYEYHLSHQDMPSLTNSVSRHTSLSSPCSQKSGSGSADPTDPKDGRVNHLPDNNSVSKFDRNNSLEGRVNGEPLGTGSSLLDGEHVVERVSSQPQSGHAGSNASSSSHLNSNSNTSSGGGTGGSKGVVNSSHQGGDGGVGSSAPAAAAATVEGKAAVNSLNHEAVGLSSEDSRDSMDYAQAALAEPLPEMSVQDAESVLGMSPLPYPPSQQGEGGGGGGGGGGGPTTPSAGVPSPLPFPPSHFPPGSGGAGGGGGGSGGSTHQPPGTPGSVGTPTSGRGAGQDYGMEPSGGPGGEFPAPPLYPPPYSSSMDMPGYHPPYGPGNYPNFNSSFHKQYNVPPDFHTGMGGSPMMRPPYPPSAHHRTPYSAMPPMAHRPPMDYRGGYHHPHHPMMPPPPPHQGGMGGGPPGSGGMRDPSMFPGPPHGMPADWQWHQQQQQQQQQSHHHHHHQRQIASLPPHLQQSHMYHQRLQQQQQQQQQLSAMRHHHQHMVALHQASTASGAGGGGSRGSPALPPPSGSPSVEHGKPPGQWHDGSPAHRSFSSKMLSEKVPSSPKLPPKHAAEQGHADVKGKGAEVDGLKRVHPDWSNCVEGTKPQLVKRRKLYAYNCGHVEPWRLMMSLKSGILADSTWALDTLTILLHDDSTCGFFNLKHHHSLLDTIVSHFKVLLTAMFHIDFEDMPQYLGEGEGEGEEGEMLDWSKEGNGEGVSVSEEMEEEGKGGDDGVTTELLLEACRSDYDILAEEESRAQEDGEGNVSSKSPAEEEEQKEKTIVKKTKKEVWGKEGRRRRRRGRKGLKIPVASVYSMEAKKLGKSNDLSHICVPSMEDQFFPRLAVDLGILPEAERQRLERESLLQRADQTPVSVLLQRELLLNQIPLHRFGRISHSPRRRDRNFFGEAARRRESTSTEERERERERERQVGGDGGAGGSSEGGGKTGAEETGNRRDSQCKSPPLLDASLGRRKSTSKSPDKKDLPAAPSPPSSSLSPPMREESEVYRKEDLPLWSVSPAREQLESRCKCISNILRSLTFVPGNDVEFCQHPGILVVLGRLLMLHHHHHILNTRDKRHVQPLSSSSSSSSPSTQATDDRSSSSSGSSSSPDTEAAAVAVGGGFDVRKVDDQQFPPAQDHWWWDCLDMLREDTLVILANISGQLDLSVFPEKISYPIIDGLLHWLVCPSSVACDPLPDSSRVYSQSPQRLVVETLAKMTISEVNVDLILATPPLMRLDLLFSKLGQMIGQKKYPVVRQFALVLLSNLAQGNESASRLIGQQKMVMSLLLESLELAEHMTCMGQGNVEGGYSRDDPTSLSVAMLRRAASTLHFLSTVPANRTAFLPYRDRILYLATSQYVEPSVSSILMDMLYEFGKL